MTAATILIVADDRAVAEAIEPQLAKVAEAVIVTTSEGVIRFMNPVAETVTGWLVAEATGRPLADVFRSIDEQTPAPLEHHDLIQKKQAAAASSTISRLELALRGSRTGIWEIEIESPNRLRYEFNCWEPLGYDWRTRPALEERSALWHPEDRARLLDAIEACVKGETDGYEVEARIRDATGVYRWRISRGVLVRDGDGRPIRLTGTATDIDDRKNAEDALRASEARFRGTFENAGVGIAHCALDGRFLRVNQKYCDILGYTRAELLALTFRDITHADDVPASLDQFSAMVRGELRGYTEDKRCLRKGEQLVWVSITVSLQRDATGTPLHSIAIIQDISERKRLQQELSKAKDDAETANRAKDEFLANVSHEIRTPMNAILGMTELSLDSQLNDDQRQWLNTVKSAAGNLLGIINDLLDFSKIEAGQLDLDITEFALRPAITDTMRALAVRADRKGIELVCDIHTSAPDALTGDVGRLRQILLNIVGNAIKFTEQGEVVLRIEIAKPAAREDQALLRFTVRDTGIGISLDKQQKIFRAFEQEDTSTTRRYGGTGLGLTIAARLVALMGGRITVESEPGRGSVFSFTAGFGRQPAALEAPVARPIDYLRNLKVLIKDENAVTRHILKSWVRDWQMDPTVVGDGLAAMDALWHGVASGKPFALAMIDVRVTGTDGLSLLGKIRERSELAATRVILLTSGTRPRDLARLSELRVDAYLLKPAAQDELLESIHLVMGRDERQGNASALTPRVLAAQAQPTRVTGKRLRVLVAEDNDINSRLMDQLLVKQGHTVQVVKNGREALASASEAVFDLLLLDLHMPELDGFQVVRALRERERSTGKRLPVIAVTARSRAEDRDRCLAAGMDDFLVKPVMPAELWATVDRVTRAARARERAVLSPAVLLASCGGDAAILKNLCDSLRDILPLEMTALEDALRNRDELLIRNVAHRLAGIVAPFSRPISDIACELEELASAGELQNVAPAVEELFAMTRELSRAAAGLTLESLESAADSPNVE